MGLRYSDLETFVKAGLTEKGYSTANPLDGSTERSMPVLNPGPFTVESLTKLSPQAMLFLVLGAGAGLAHEGVFDQPFIIVRAIGVQHSFANAEGLAYDVDDLLNAVDTTTMVGDTRTLFITRTGGAPQLIDLDSADRYHFQTTYITEAPR